MCEFVQKVEQILPESNLLNIISAVLILLIGWGIALLVSMQITSLLHKIAAKSTGKDGKDESPVNGAETVAGKVIYYVILIITVLACLSALDLYTVAAPLQEFINNIAGYVPNIAGAILLAVIAWIIAGILRIVVRAAILKSSFCERYVEQMGGKSPEEAANYTANTVFYIVFLFFLPAILNALRIFGVTKPLQSMFEKILTYIPNLVFAGLILAIGLFAASVVRKAVTGIIVLSRLNAFGEKVGVSKFFGNGGLASMIGLVAYVLIAIPVIISALTALQVEVLSKSVGGFFNKLLNATGDIVGAALVIFVSVLIGSFVSSLVTKVTAAFGADRLPDYLGLKSNDPADAQKSTAFSVILGKLTFIVIIVMAILACCDILGFKNLASIVHIFAAFGGNVLLSIVVILIGLWLANFTASVIKGKCNDIIVGGVRCAVIVFTIALAISNLKIGDSIVQIAFTLILGSVCVAAAIAFGIGGREAAAKILNSLAEKITKK